MVFLLRAHIQLAYGTILIFWFVIAMKTLAQTNLAVGIIY